MATFGLARFGLAKFGDPTNQEVGGLQRTDEEPLYLSQQQHEPLNLDRTEVVPSYLCTRGTTTIGISLRREEGP